MALDVKTVQVTPFDQNCRVLFDSISGEAVVVDPGGDFERIEALLDAAGVRCSQIWLTHSHIDHCGGVQRLKDASGAPLYGHPDEQIMRSAVTTICAMYGFPDADLDNCPEPEHYIRGGEILRGSGGEWKVIAAPGHSPGHVTFYSAEHGILVGGDVLFAGSIGRTDLPGGDHRTLLKSIANLMEKLPPNTRVLPGHGPETTLAAELQTNPFLRG